QQKTKARSGMDLLKYYPKRMKLLVMIPFIVCMLDGEIMLGLRGISSYVLINQFRDMEHGIMVILHSLDRKLPVIDLGLSFAFKRKQMKRLGLRLAVVSKGSLKIVQT